MVVTKRVQSRIRLTIITFSILGFLYYYTLPTTNNQRLGYGQGVRVTQPHIPCSEIPNADNIVILLKTGANEVEQRLPVLERTLLKCAPHSLVFSDVEQMFEGRQIHDALAQILPQYLENEDPDMIHYNRLQEAYASGTASSIARDAGWKLDRFKYLPMMQSAYATYPNAHWFVFIETDTAVIWSNLITWLGQMDPQVPQYMGSEVVGGKAPGGKKDLIFAHGGSGFVISQGAAAKLVDAIAKEEEKFFNFAKNDCCGDAIMARALWEVKVFITPAYPIANGETPETAEYTKEWCFAPVFFHHMSQEAIQEVHTFDELKSTSTTITYAEIFEAFVAGRFIEEKSDWDNMINSKIIQDKKNSIPQTFESCKAKCLQSNSCLQFNFRSGECRLGSSIRYGRGANGIQSGWILERIEAFLSSRTKCQPTWIL